jgi:hypothetical protein
MSYDEAIRAVLEGTYKTKGEDELRDMLRACMDIHGPNPVALHRITHAADIIRSELAARHAARLQEQTMGENRRLHRKTQAVAWIAVALAAIALLLDTGGCLSSKRAADSPGQTKAGEARVPQRVSPP